jgi:RHS repeat-associated protein
LTTCTRAGGCAGTNYPFLTLKERDVETGLGFFEARYYANVQGRFTSPDPLFFQKEMLLDPQRFNLYAYVRNNPLKLVDPNGLAIELTGDEAERKRKLDLIRQSVGKEAGAYLYENKAKDGKYYVGIYNDGKSKPFEQVNSVAGTLRK